jgi:hypothetical protein
MSFYLNARERYTQKPLSPLPYQMTRILAFDIGIKNLAWCCLERTSNETILIHEWDNYNLLSDSSNVEPKEKTKCQGCSQKGLYRAGDLLFCARHCPAATPPLRDTENTLLKKIPKLQVCRAILSAKGLVKVPSKKEQVHQELAKLFALPETPVKVSKAPDAGLVEIHSSIQSLVKKHATLWSTCSLILLENQPAFKNPTMKSVQILLFATLRDLLSQPPPQLKLVHAGKKVQGEEKGDAGYKARKAGSEARAEAFLKSPTLQNSLSWKPFYEKAAKKSDLADALAMCLDASPQPDKQPASA